MRFAATLLVALLALASSAWGQDQAFTNRATELKEKGDAQSKTVASLTENTAVKVLGRGGGYTQVEANGQKGWVRAFHLRCCRQRIGRRRGRRCKGSETQASDCRGMIGPDFTLG